MEGVNLAACFLGVVGIPAFGVVSLVAFGPWIAGKTSAARITFASGVMGAALVAALAALSFLERGMGYHQEGSDPTIVLAALTLLVAGAGQFLAARAARTSLARPSGSRRCRWCCWRFRWRARSCSDLASCSPASR